MDNQKFINCKHSLLIAPAGYGKTYTIASCLQLVEGTHLVLTHTNAGIASIYEKIRKLGVSSSLYQIETISSFAQKIALSYTFSSSFPPQEESNLYYKSILKRATELIKIVPIKKMLRNSFSGLFVDEYQDCTILQHFMIKELAEIFPTHILGDPLQGIFGFDEEDPLVDLSDSDTMGDFLNNRFELDKPWRWIIQGKEELAEDLKRIRENLEQTKAPIQDFSLYKSIVFHSVERRQLYESTSNVFRSEMNKLVYSGHNILFIHSNSVNRFSRINYVVMFSDKIHLLEAIDDLIFYSTAKSIDNWRLNDLNAINNIYNLLIIFFGKSGIEKWIKNGLVINKRKLDDVINMDKLKLLIVDYEASLNLIYLSNLLEFFHDVLGFKTFYADLYYSINHSIKYASYNSTSVYEEITKQRNITRRVGRKLLGKTIGTTLLTKGLECDTVVLLEEEPFDYKNQYVALTRGSKEVIVFQIKKMESKSKMEKQKTSNIQYSLEFIM